MRAKPSTWAPPRPLRPATPMRITSLAPRTLPDDLVPAIVTVAAAASVLFRNLRRVRRDIAYFLSRWREFVRRKLPYTRSKAPTPAENPTLLTERDRKRNC